MKKYFYLFIVIVISSGLTGCGSQHRRGGYRGNNPGTVLSPVHRSQTVQLRGRNLGNTQSIDLSVALPYDNTADLLEYEGYTNIQGRIQLNSFFKCLSGSHAAFNCEAEVNNRVIEMPNCNIRGNIFQMRVYLNRSSSSTHRYDIIGVEVNSPECFLNRTRFPSRANRGNWQHY